MIVTLKLKCTVQESSTDLKRDGTTGHPRKETYCQDPSPDRLEFLSCHSGNLRDPQAFPRHPRQVSQTLQAS